MENLDIDGKDISLIRNLYCNQMAYMRTEDRLSPEIHIKRGVFEIARSAFNSMLKTITARHISMKTRKKIIKAYVWSTILYGCETWTITTRNMKKLQSFEMWAYRKMMKISWRENKTNKEVLEMVDEQLYINSTIEKRKIPYFGHMIRRNNIHMVLLEGPLEGKVSRGRPIMEWMTNIIEWTGMRYEDLGCLNNNTICHKDRIQTKIKRKLL